MTAWLIAGLRRWWAGLRGRPPLPDLPVRKLTRKPVTEIIMVSPVSAVLVEEILAEDDQKQALAPVASHD